MKFQTVFFLVLICIGNGCQSATIPTPELISTEPNSTEPTTQLKPAEKRFAELILDGTRAVILSSRGQMPHAWIGASNEDDLRAVPHEDDGVTWPMGDGWTHTATLLEYGGIMEVAPGSFTAIKFGALVFPDETVRLGKMRVNELSNRRIRTEADAALPEFGSYISSIVEKANNQCQLPIFSSEDLPPEKNIFQRYPKSFSKSCEALQGLNGNWSLGWTEDFVVFVTKENKTVALESFLRIENEKPVLRKVKLTRWAK